MKVKLSKSHKAFLEAPFGINAQVVKSMIESYEDELEQVKAAISEFLEKLSYQHGNLTQKDGYYTMYENANIYVYSPMYRLVYRFQHACSSATCTCPSTFKSVYILKCCCRYTITPSASSTLATGCSARTGRKARSSLG